MTIFIDPVNGVEYDSEAPGDEKPGTPLPPIISLEVTSKSASGGTAILGFDTQSNSIKSGDIIEVINVGSPFNIGSVSILSISSSTLSYLIGGTTTINQAAATGTIKSKLATETALKGYTIKFDWDPPKENYVIGDINGLTEAEKIEYAAFLSKSGGLLKGQSRAVSYHVTVQRAKVAVPTTDLDWETIEVKRVTDTFYVYTAPETKTVAEELFKKYRALIRSIDADGDQSDLALNTDGGTLGFSESANGPTRAPQIPVLLPVVRKTLGVLLRWEDPDDPTQEPLQYKVYASKTSKDLATTLPVAATISANEVLVTKYWDVVTKTMKDFTREDANDPCHFIVVAVNALGVSLPTASVQGSPAKRFSPWGWYDIDGVWVDANTASVTASRIQTEQAGARIEVNKSNGVDAPATMDFVGPNADLNYDTGITHVRVTQTGDVSFSNGVVDFSGNTVGTEILTQGQGLIVPKRSKVVARAKVNGSIAYNDIPPTTGGTADFALCWYANGAWKKSGNITNA